MHPSTTMRSHRYRSSGRCIYCTRPADEAGKLTEEHIVPLALNGTLIIEGAACEPCRDRSNRVYEQPALNADLLVPRLLLELKRRKKNKPKPLPPVAIGSHAEGGGVFDVQLEASQYPPIITLTVLQRAGRIVGVDRGADLSGFRLQLYNMGRQPGAEHFRGSLTTNHKMDPTPFALTLVKIAYCYAVAEVGLDQFDGREVRELLQGDRSDVYNFVGSPEERPRLTDRHLHGLYLRQHGALLTVLVHLFASCKMHPYEVVVGTLK